MTPREVVRANIEYRCQGRIAFSFTGEADRLNDFVGTGCDHRIPTRRWEDGDVEYSTDIWGNVWHRMIGLSQGGEIFAPALPDWAGLDDLVLPDLANPECYEGARALGASDTDRFRVGFMPGWPFASCRYLRRMETYFVDLIAEPELVDRLHQRVTALLEDVIDQFGQAGIDGIMFCEDLGTQDRTLMSAPMWRRTFKPLYQRLTGCAHRYGMKVIMHSCGRNWELIDDLCEAGVDCLQFDQPAVYDLEKLAAKLRKHGVGLFAPCDIQKVLPTGDRALIERETRRLVDTFRGGLIAKNYGDLHGIGVDPEWDRWAYEAFVAAATENRSGAG